MFKFNWQMELQKLQMETIKYQKSCPLLKDFVFFSYPESVYRHSSWTEAL